MDVLLSVYAIKENAIFPNILTQDNPGLLLRSTEEIDVARGDYCYISTGLRINLPTGYWAEIRSVRSMLGSGFQVQCQVVPTVCFLKFIHPFYLLFINFF